MQYDNTNRGALWAIDNNPPKVVLQGKVDIKGHEKRIMAVNRTNALGENIMVLVQEIATLKPNKSENENAPNATGVLEVTNASGTMSLSAWKKEHDGKQMLSLSVSEFDTQLEKTQESTTDKLEELGDEITSAELDEEIPF